MGLKHFSIILKISGAKPWESSWLLTAPLAAKQSCVWEVTLDAFVFEFELISFLFTLLIRRQKLALIMLFAAEYSFNCYGRKKFKEGDFSCKPFPIRQSWKFRSSPPLLIYHERTKGAKWKFDKTNKGLPKQRLLLCFLSFVLNEYRQLQLSIGIAGKKNCPLVKFPP